MTAKQLVARQLIPAAIALLLGACAGMPATHGDREDRADIKREAMRANTGSDAATIAETWLSEMLPADNIDSPAAWAAPDGGTWVISTAKSSDQLVVYDGDTGTTLQRVGGTGSAAGRFDRPNGVFVADDLLFVVERDNRRVQLMHLPEFTTLAMFGQDELVQPYGVWVDRTDAGYEVYVTDNYMAGEDAAGEDILPPLGELDHRVHRYLVSPAAEGHAVRHLGAFGDTSADGALRVVESVWGDRANDRLLIAEEDESYANELKVYGLDGKYAGRTIGRDVFKAQSEGIALKTCADGSGWWLTTEQGKGRTVLHLFDRNTLQHAGAVAGKLVANTDGIWLHDAPTPRFPDGALYAVHDDQGVVALDWRDIARALSLHDCPRAGAPKRQPEPNTLVPSGDTHYAPSGFPERIVATPAQDAATGFQVSWRTGASIEAPVLEIAIASDSPDQGIARRVRASTRGLRTENGMAHHHRADVAGLVPDTLYAWRVQGANGWWSPWRQLRTAALPGNALTLLYFGDTQNKNASLVSRVAREALRHAPEARLALYAGDLVSGGDGEDDNEWGEWFDATGVVASGMLVAPAAGNHEYFEEFEDTPQERRVLGAHWPVSFALPGNGAPGAELTSYWFDFQDARVVVLDGTSALDLGTAKAQAKWLDGVLAGNPRAWSLAMIHQPMFSPRQDRDNALLREHVLPVLERHRVDLVLQGHDHVYGRRGGLSAGQGTPQYLVSVAGAKQYLLSDRARKDMAPVGEDTQLFQVVRIDGDTLRYEARTVTGRLYDAFSLRPDGKGGRRVEEQLEGRIAPRDCPRDATLKGRTDRCWE